ncbi:hypothetical protein OPIT5_07955 [Opitutaceae bacterium TAV5]|nr:hypothetical protein OPIT5_07955 [Opitutaceae bacterium TAV5]
MTRTDRLPRHCIAASLALGALLLATALPGAPAPTTRGQGVTVTATPDAGGQILAFTPEASSHEKGLRGAAAFPLRPLVPTTGPTGPWTLTFTLRLDEDAGFAADAGKDVLHVFDAPAFNYTTHARQTWGFSIREKHQLVLWNGDGKGGVAATRTRVVLRPGATTTFIVSVDPAQRRWALSVQAQGDAQPATFSGLGFRSGESAPGGLLMITTLHDPEPSTGAPRPLRLHLGTPAVTPGASVPVAASAASGNFIRNAGFANAGLLADALLWHRMRDIGYLAPAGDASVPVLDPAPGESPAIRIPGGSTLSIPAEVWETLPKPPWTFSVRIRADRDNAPARLAVETYRLHDRETHTRDIRAGRDWQRVEITVKDSHRHVRRQGRIQGPLNFRITSLDPTTTLRIDNPQWEPGERATAFRPSVRDARRPAGSFVLLTAPPGSGFAPVPVRMTRSGAGHAPLFAILPGENPRRHVPLSLGVPFPAGEWDGTGPVTLVREGAPADAPAIPVQTEILARWPGDGSVQSLGVIFEADMTPGENRWLLGYGRGPENRSAPATPSGPTAGSFQGRITFAGLEAHIGSQSGALWESIRDTATGVTVFGQAVIEATGADGAYYSSRYSPEIVTGIEQDGPVRITVAKRGLLATQDGEHALLQFICRLHFWKHQPGPDIELTLVNSTTANDTVALRDVAFVTHASGISARTPVTLPWSDAPLGDTGLAALQSFNHAAGEWSRGIVRDRRLADIRAGERGPLWLSLPTAASSTLFLDVRNAWQQHPAMLAAAPDGRLAGYVWPAAPVIGLEWSPGLSVTREFRLRAVSGQSGISTEAAGRQLDNLKSETGGETVLARVDPGWLAKTDILTPLAPADETRLPFIEKRLSSPDGLAGQSPAVIEEKHYYGLFDYGDAGGDGGWANLESYRDYAALLRGSRMRTDAIFRQGLASATHYRDVDIQQVTGRTITHSVNHTIGGHDFGHAWPEGIMAHYLLTGSRRTREVIHQNLATLLALPPDDNDISYGRNLGFFLMTLSRAYQLTGDVRYRDRFVRQLDHAESVLADAARKRPELMQLTPQPRDGSLFYWPASGIVPFALWYGLEGLLHMHDLADDAPALKARLRAHIDREFHIALDLDRTYRFHLEQLWPGLPAEESFPLMVTEYAHGRGAFLFPVAAAYARLSGERRWAGFALRALYANAMINAERPENVLGAAILPRGPAAAEFDEARFVDETRDLLWRAAADTLPNGDFAHYEPYDALLARTTRTGYKPRFATPWLYPCHWRLVQGKELTATELMKRRQKMATLDTETFHAAAPAFRFDLDRGDPFTQRTSLTSAFFRLPAGRHVFSWWFREGDGAALAQCSLFLSDLDGNRPVLDIRIPDTSAGLEIRNGTPLRITGSALSAPDAAGWREARVEFDAPARFIASATFIAELRKSRGKARLWLDDVTVHPDAEL